MLLRKLFYEKDKEPEVINMTIDKQQNGAQLILSVAGKLDTLTSPQLEKVVQEELNGVQNLTLDLSQVHYVSSAGLRVCLSAQKHMNAAKGTLVIKGVIPEVMEVFELAGFTDIMKFAK